MKAQPVIVNPMKVILAAIAFSLVMLLTVWAFAQQGQIQLHSVAKVAREVVNEEGQKEVRLVPAEKVLPGTEVVYINTYENIGQQAAENAVITNPIPEHMVYQEGSAQGAGTRITFSVDGGKTYDTPAKLTVKDASGRTFPARPKDYTHIRWTLQEALPPGAKGEVRFRAVLK